MVARETGARFQFGLRHLMATVAAVALVAAVMAYSVRPGPLRDTARALLALSVVFTAMSAGPLVYAARQRWLGKNPAHAGFFAGAINGAVVWAVTSLTGHLLFTFATQSIGPPIDIVSLCFNMVLTLFYASCGFAIWGWWLGFCVQWVSKRDSS